MTVRVNVRAHPNARREEVRLVGPDCLEIWVRAPARDGRANHDIERVVSQALGVRPSAVQIVRGAMGREKVLAIDGIDRSALQGLPDGHSN
jgi:uncharacterized protein (TIGR00251 family)